MSDSDLPGTGVDPTKVINPTTRFKKAWRQSGAKLSLKAWAREQWSVDADNKDDINIWLYRKSAAYTAEARKERKARVRVAQAASRANRPAGGTKKGKGK